MKVTAVTVTYGNRFYLVDRVLDALVAEGVDEIWVVSNGANAESLTGLSKKADQYEQIRLVTFSENLGSAGAYAEVFQRLYEGGQDRFIWLLDDDNLLIPGAVSALRQTYSLLKEQFGETVLYSYREYARKGDPKAVSAGLIKGPRANTYCGFALSDIFRSSDRTRSKSTSKLQVDYPVVAVRWGPYGGMFSNLATFKRVGLPSREFFVYADDQEFSYRFFQNGIPQFLVYSSQVKDMELSVGDGGGYFAAKTSLVKIFYGLRNTIHLSGSLRNNWWVYQVNRFAFRSIMLLLAAKSFVKNPGIVTQRLPWIWKAIRDGESGRLGKIDFDGVLGADNR